MFIEIVLFIVLLTVIATKSWKRPLKFPPGPRGLPLLGYAPFVAEHHPVYPFKAMEKLAEIYGPVVGFYIGPFQPFISVCGNEAVREASNNDDLNGRPHLASIEARTFYERLGLMFTDGELWQEQRRFSMRHLRDLGFGKASIEGHMLNEVDDLVKEIREEAGSNFDNIVDFKGTLNVSVVNILWAIIGGKRFPRDDYAFRQLLASIERFFRSGNVLRPLPVPAFILKRFESLKTYAGLDEEAIERMQQFITGSIDEHLQNRSSDSRNNDFIDVYLEKMEKEPTNSTFSKKQLIASILDLFAAGAESTSNSIGFAILHLIHNQEAQRKMQEELDQVCGNSVPQLADRASLPYTEAVLMEAQRLSSIAPFTVPHYALRDTEIQGYFIPKGSIVQLNLHSVLNDKNTWKDVDTFCPERHLDINGKIVKTDHFYPFGLGKRMCSGEALAKNTYFLFTATLVKLFQFKPVQGQPLPTLDPINGVTLGYEGFKAAVLARA